MRLLFPFATVVGLVAAVHLLPSPAKDWPSGRPEAWMLELYQHRLPRVAFSAGAYDYVGRVRRLRRAVDDAAELAAPAPELAAAIRALQPLLVSLHRRQRSVERAVDAVNEAARTSRIPFYLDVELVPVRGVPKLHFVSLKSYRIERVRRARQGRGEYTALWVTRVDQSSALDARLGWTRHDEHHGMVVLDVVRDYWLRDVGPALAGLEESTVQRIYGAHRELLLEDLTRASAALLELEPTSWRPLLRARLDCFVEERPDCADIAGLVDAAAVEVLARKVETHELQHVIDGRRLHHPKPLRFAMTSHPPSAEEEITFAAAELSAYLAEIARSDQPRIALVHFIALAALQPDSPEGFAGRVALAHLLVEGEDREDLLELPERELSSRALRAYEALFEKRLPPLTRRDA